MQAYYLTIYVDFFLFFYISVVLKELIVELTILSGIHSFRHTQVRPKGKSFKVKLCVPFPPNIYMKVV